MTSTYLLALLLLFSGKPSKKADFYFTLTMKNNRPLLSMVSNTTFECSNYGILLRQGWTNDTLTVNILGIDSRTNCNNVPDKAREQYELHGIHQQEFVLRFLYNRKYNYFRVEYDDGDFSLTPIQTEGFITSVTP